MEIDDSTLYESFRYRILEEMIEETKQKSGYFLMIVDKKSLGIISGAVTVLDLTERGVTVIEQLEKIRKPMPEVDVLYFLTPSFKSINRLTNDFIEQVPYRQAHVFFTGKVNDKLMRTIANSSIMPYIKTFKEVNCAFRLVGKDCFSLEYSGLLGNLYLSKTFDERKEIISYISQSLASVLGVMRELPYICYQSSSVLTKELATSLNQEINTLYRKLPNLPIKQTRPTMIIIDRNYDLAFALSHDVHYEALLKDIFEVGLDGKVKYESVDNSGILSAKEAILNEKDHIWAKLRYEEVDEAQRILNFELKIFRDNNQEIEGAANEPNGAQNLKTMAKVVSGLSYYNETVNKFAVHRYLLDACMKTFADEDLTTLSSIEQMILTGFNSEKKEYKESEIVASIVKKIRTLTNEKEKLRLALIGIIGMELSASDRKMITDSLPSELALNITKLAAFGISLEASGKTKKRLERVYINSLLSRTLNITKIFNYAIPRLNDIVCAANAGTLDTQGFEFDSKVPFSSEEIQPQVKSLRKKQNNPNKLKKKVIVFILGGVSYNELRVLKEFPDAQVVIGGTSIMSPLEFVNEIIKMSKENEIPDIDPRDIEIDFR